MLVFITFILMWVHFGIGEFFVIFFYPWNLKKEKKKKTINNFIISNGFGARFSWKAASFHSIDTSCAYDKRTRIKITTHTHTKKSIQKSCVAFPDWCAIFWKTKSNPRCICGQACLLHECENKTVSSSFGQWKIARLMPMQITEYSRYFVQQASEIHYRITDNSISNTFGTIFLIRDFHFSD